MGKRDDRRDSKFGGYILIILGAFFLLSKFITWLTFDLLWPIILIGLGIHIISKNNASDDEIIVKKEGDKQDEK